MTRRRPDPCADHRPALVDFVEGRALGPHGPAALDHLARCAPCERNLSEVAQTVIALRRLGARAEVEAPPDGWAALRERIERSQQAADDAARRFRRAFGGAVVAVSVAVLVAVPSLTGTLTTGVADGLATRADPRPASAEMRRYDPFAQRLTEGIVLAIAGGGPARVSVVVPVAGGPTSKDRHDGQPAVHVTPFSQPPIAPKSAYRT